MNFLKEFIMISRSKSLIIYNSMIYNSTISFIVTFVKYRDILSLSNTIWEKHMIAENINDVKNFMSTLLIKDSFDKFLVTDVTIVTYNTFHIDGHINKDFYTNEEFEDIKSPLLSSWAKLKPFCFDIIKGKKTPLYFKIIFSLPEMMIEKLLHDNDILLTKENIANLFLNIKYDKGVLSYTTGTSLNIFTIDKSLEKAFDLYISEFISTLS